MHTGVTQLLPVMYGIGNDDTTGDEVHQHKHSAHNQTDVGISHWQIGNVRPLLICHAHTVINGAGPYEPNLNKCMHHVIVYVLLDPLSARWAR